MTLFRNTEAVVCNLCTVLDEKLSIEYIYNAQGEKRLSLGS